MTRTHTHDHTGTETRSVLARLRLLPRGSFHDRRSQRLLAERQAALLRYLTATTGTPIDDTIRQQPHLRVQYGNIPTSGLSHWNGHEWVITLNRYEPRTRQRLTLLHEYKHIIDHHDATELYRDRHDATAEEQAEQAADYFAGCALVPTPLLTDAYTSGTTNPETLARLFDVSVPAINVRLMQTGLEKGRKRCGVVRSATSSPERITT